MKKNETDDFPVKQDLIIEKKTTGTMDPLSELPKVISMNTNTVHQNKLKIDIVGEHFREIIKVLGLDLDDEILKLTAPRMARYYVQDLCAGLDLLNKPNISLLENKSGYRQMIVNSGLYFQYTCKYYLTALDGQAHVGYFPSSKIINNKDLHSLIRFAAQKPISQEELVTQIADELKSLLHTTSIAVVIDAESSHEHYDNNSQNKRMVTMQYDGRFLREEVKKEFLSFIK